GNINIDNFIKGTYSSSFAISTISKREPFLQWVSFEEFKDVKKIGQGGFCQIFKATWNFLKASVMTVK
ncbi:9227_t:CDS:1, partial [Diversispora eburnea]